jgi:hypothetical protein
MVSLDKLKSEGLEDFTSSIETNFRNEGYVLVRKCSCEQAPPKERIRELQERYERCYKTTGKVYQPKDEERLYREHVKCLHYQCPNLGHVVLTVEGFQEMIGDLGKAMKQGYIEGLVTGAQVRRSGGGKLELLKESFKHRKNIEEISPPISLGIIACYTYGNDLESREENTEFVCKENRLGFLNESWGKRLGLPKVVKRIDERLLRNSCK